MSAVIGSVGAPVGANAQSAHSSPTDRAGVMRAAGAMGAATLISRVMGLVREQVFAVLFGAGNATDAFNIAFRIPNLLRDLFAEGAMSAALVPTFTRVRKEEGERRAWRTAGLVFRTLFFVVLILAVAGIVFAPQLVSLYADSFKKVPGKYEITVAMTRIMFPFFPLVALAAAFMGILNACGKYFMPAFASALFNITSVVVGAALAMILPHYGYQPILGMAIGVVFGGCVQAFSQLPILRTVGYRYPSRIEGEPVWHRDPALRRMMALMIPGTVGLAATQVNVLVNSVLATSQGPGAVSWLNYAFRLMQFPIGIFGVSLAAATLPRVSALWVDRDVKGISDQLTHSLKQVFAVNLPASAGLAFLGFPIIQLLFQYGRFFPEDVQATANALAAYSLGLSAYSAVKVLVPACYALGRTRIAVISSMISVGLTIALNLVMVGPFGYVGLALGTSFAAVLNCVFLMVSLRRALTDAGGEWPIWPLVRSFLIHAFAAVLMGLACWATYSFVGPMIPDRLVAGAGKLGTALFRAVKVGLWITVGFGVLWGVARALGLQETLDAIHVFEKKLKNQVSRFRK